MNYAVFFTDVKNFHLFIMITKRSAAGFLLNT